ncbi:3 beta-hydroxysteroid dehydrogenase/Delta 5--_4-isomerase [subsurface metagenome]
MKVLVTGGTGFAGSHLVDRLISEGFEVRVIARSSKKAEKLKERGVEIILGNITDKDVIKEAVNGVKKVYHLAANWRTAGVPDKVYWDVNVGGTRNLLEASIKENIERFVHCSTMGVHGHVDEIPSNENTRYNPGDIYQVTKLEAEKLALNFYKEKGLPVSVIRPCAIYGPGDMRLLKMFRAIAKKRFIMLGSGETLYHMVYVTDLAEGFRLAADRQEAVGEAFLIGGDEYVSLNRLVEIIANGIGVSTPKIHFPVWPVELLGTIVEKICIPLRIEPPIYKRRVLFFTKDRAFDISKAKNILGYRPKVDLITGIKKTVKWYKENGYL